MDSAQARMPLAVKGLTGMVMAAVALLAAHNGLGVAWPPVLPASWWDWLYNAIELASVLLCGARVLLRSEDRGAWLAITIGLLLFGAGDLYYSLVWGDANSVPTPSVADALYLGFYPAAYVGIGLLVRGRMRHAATGLRLDAVIGAVAIAAVGAAVMLRTVLANPTGPPLTVATNLAYPLGDLFLLGIVLGIIGVSGGRARGAWLWLAAGLTVFAVADAIYLVQTATNSYVSNGILDVGWPGAMVVMALAAWRPQRGLQIRATEGWGRFVAPAVAALCCIALEAIDHFVGIPLIAHLLAIGCLLLVIVRLGVSFAENHRMLEASRREAVTDALTGLGNRRALELELATRLGADQVRPFVLAFYDLDGFKAYNDAFGHQAGDSLLARLGARLAAALPEAGVFRMGGDEFCVVVSECDGGASVATRGADSLTARGASFAVGCSFGMVEVPREASDAETAMLLADARMYDRKGERRTSAASESQEVLLRALAERDQELGAHNHDVADLVELVGLELGLERAELVPVLRAAELHDVGKLAIPDAILNKPGPLDDAEWEFMRSHTIIGERIVASATSLQTVAPIVRATHEAWDGGGYPDGLAAEAIPLGARIIAVCDAFDAMTTTRAYRGAMSCEEARSELQRCAGRQFDPEVVAAFLRVHEAEEEARTAAPSTAATRAA
jgi:two-component system, cell cycle response regulator